MTKLLQNRWSLVSALVAALVVWIGDLRSPRGSVAGGTPRPRPVTGDAPSNPWPLAETLGPESWITGALREWISQQPTNQSGLRDDPFLYFAETPPVVAPPRESPSLLVPPVLRAISLGAGQPLAFIDGSICGEGDPVGPWRVSKIEASTVWIEGPDGRIGLQLHRDSAPAAAKAAPEPPSIPKETHDDVPSKPSTPKSR